MYAASQPILQSTPVVLTTPAPRRPYRRRYTKARTRRPYKRRLSRGLRTFYRARKQYPASKYAYGFIPRTADTLAKFGPTYRLATPEQREARQTNAYYGQGKYKFLKSAWKFAKPILGSALKQGVSNYMQGHGIYDGQGEYMANELVAGADSDTIPQFSTSQDETGTLRISHKEYIGEVYGNESGDNFHNRSFPLNPGMEETFPWLSQIAQNFEEYEFHQLMFTYRSVVADVSSNNGQVGTAIMVTNYNPATPAFTDKAQMMEYTASSSCKVTESMIHGVECDNAKLSGTAEKYVRSGNLPQGEDLKQYDQGTFQLATANTPTALADNSIGEVWVSYTVTLRKPKVFTGRGGGTTRYEHIVTQSLGIVGSSSSIEDGKYVLFGYNGTTYGGFGADGIQNSFTPLLSQSATEASITLPGNIRGVFALRIYIEGLSDTAMDLKLGPPGLSGNVTAFNDIAPGAYVGDTGADTLNEPTWWFSSTHRRPTNTADKGECLYFECHVKVDVASGNVNNVFTWNSSNPLAVGHAGGTAVGNVDPKRIRITINEYNGEEWQTSNAVAWPQWVKNGIVVDPFA
jgi:hypothetical protein